MTPQQKALHDAIEIAWVDANRIRAYEISSGISEPYELGNAEGFAEGLGSAYLLTYGEPHLSDIVPCTEDNYQMYLDQV